MIIVAEALEDMSSFSFSYQLVEQYDLFWIPVLAAAAIFFITLIVACCIFFPLQVMTKNSIHEKTKQWKVKANDMMMQMKKAQKDHEDFMMNDGRVPGNGVTLDEIMDESKPNLGRHKTFGRQNSIAGVADME